MGNIVLIGDANQKRANFIKSLLHKDLGMGVEMADTFDQLRDKLDMLYWDCILVADDLPISHSLPKRSQRKVINKLPQKHFEYLEGHDYGRRLGVICSQLRKEPDKKTDNSHFLYVPVPDLDLEVAHNAREKVVSALSNVLSANRVSAKYSQKPATIHLKGSLLREQICTLGDKNDYEDGEMHIGQLSAAMFGCDKVNIAQLGQGKSGARVFLTTPFKRGREIGNYVLKIVSWADLPKITRETQKYFEAVKNLGNNKRFHGAKLIAPKKPSKFGQSASSPHSNGYVVSTPRWHAIGYDYLGGEGVENLIDLENALLLSSDDLFSKTQKTQFKFTEGNELQASQMRIKIFQTLIEWLCGNFYEIDGKTKREHRKLWLVDGDATSQNDEMPPYWLSTRTKAKINEFLKSSAMELGRRLFDSSYEKRSENLRQFLNGEGKIPKRLDRELSVILSPAHGDLNANNIFLWMKDDGHPFLIDFPYYQECGHALQDFARLEVEIIYSLMDRRADIPKSNLLAFDHTASQTPIWKKLQEQLIGGDWRDKLVIGSEAGYKKNVQFSFELICLLRARAYRIHGKFLDVKNASSFTDEYFPPLLFHTLRAIGYESLSIFKRLLAVYSAGLIFEELDR